MINQKLFLDSVRDVMGEGVSPSHLLTQWDEFVNSCAEGYQWDVSEYNNEITVRNKLDHLLSSTKLQSFDELQQLRNRVKDIDNRFKCLLREDIKLEGEKPWWEKGVLKSAGSDYASFFQKAYNVDIEIVG